MLNGLWTAKFEALGKSGSGIAVFVGAKIRGGDSAFIWNGTFQEQGDFLKGDVHVKKFNPTLESLFGINEYDLHIEGKIQGDTIKGTGTSKALPPGVSLNMVFVKRVNLS